MPTPSSDELVFRLAVAADEPLVRDVLSSEATGGLVQLCFQRGPNALAADVAAGQREIILAFTRHGDQLVGICERIVRSVFLNGKVRRLPYLAALRVLPGFRHRLRVLRGGFEALRCLPGHPDDLPYSITSIMSDNLAARRLLGANLPGMPRYEPVTELSTFVMATGGDSRLAPASDSDLAQIAHRLLQTGAGAQFASVWTEDALRSVMASGSLRPRDFFLVRRGGEIRSCAALWDRRQARPLVVKGYAPWLARTRPLLNAFASLARLPRLPAPGGPLDAAYLSHLSVDPSAPEDLSALVAAVRAEAARRGISLLLAGGMASAHPASAALRSLRRQREMRSLLYVVRWPDAPVPQLQHGFGVAPELALL